MISKSNYHRNIASGNEMKSALTTGSLFIFITLTVTRLSFGQSCKLFNFDSAVNYLFLLCSSQNAFQEGEMSNRGSYS